MPFFPTFQYWETTVQVLNITFIFGRSRRSLILQTSDKYKGNENKCFDLWVFCNCCWFLFIYKFNNTISNCNISSAGGRFVSKWACHLVEYSIVPYKHNPIPLHNLTIAQVLPCQGQALLLILEAKRYFSIIRGHLKWRRTQAAVQEPRLVSSISMTWPFCKYMVCVGQSYIWESEFSVADYCWHFTINRES